MFLFVLNNNNNDITNASNDDTPQSPHQDFKQLALLGEGAYSAVYKAWGLLLLLLLLSLLLLLLLLRTASTITIITIIPTASMRPCRRAQRDR